MKHKHMYATHTLTLTAGFVGAAREGGEVFAVHLEPRGVLGGF